MSKFLTGLGGGSGVTVAAVAGAVVLAVVAWSQFGGQKDAEVTPAVAVMPETKDVPVAQAPAQSVPEVVEDEPETAPESARVAEEPNEVAEETIAPAFDEVRREADGITVIAGRAAPGADVQILQDGEVIGSATADRSGKFAAILMIAPDGKGHLLSLLQTLGQETVASLDEIILAPLAAPVVIAEADISVADEPEPTATAPEIVKQVIAEAALPETSAPETPAPATDVETADVEPSTDANEVAQALPDMQTKTVEKAEATPDENVVVQPQNTEVVEQTQQPDVIEQAQSDDGDVAADVAAVVESVEPETPSDAAVTSADPQTIVTEAPQEAEGITDTVDVAQAEASPAEPTVTVAEVAQEQPAKPAIPEASSPSDTPPSDFVVAEVKAPEPTKPETTEVAVLKSTPEGVELLNPAAPEVMDNVALDTISYSEGGDVLLSGRAQTNTRAVRVYLNNAVVASLDVAPDGKWRGDLPNIDQGIYTLRVDEVASDGSVTSRVETPFKREDPVVLAAASAAQSGPIKAITVQKGATLWAIARERYGSGELYVRVFEANRASIRDADLIYPGQVFDLPD